MRVWLPEYFSGSLSVNPLTLGAAVVAHGPTVAGGPVNDTDGVVRGWITGPYADDFLLPVRLHTHSETWRHSRQERKANNQRSQQKQGARFTRVHIYNQM